MSYALSYAEVCTKPHPVTAHPGDVTPYVSRQSIEAQRDEQRVQQAQDQVEAAAARNGGYVEKEQIEIQRQIQELQRQKAAGLPIDGGYLSSLITGVRVQDLREKILLQSTRRQGTADLSEMSREVSQRVPGRAPPPPPYPPRARLNSDGYDMGDDHYYSDQYSGADDEHPQGRRAKERHRGKATADRGSQYHREDESRYDMRTLAVGYDEMDTEGLQYDERLGGIPYASGTLLVV